MSSAGFEGAPSYLVPGRPPHTSLPMALPKATRRPTVAVCQVEEHLGIGDPDAVVPTNAVQLLGAWSGGSHLATDRDDLARVLAQLRGPGVDCQHHTLGPHASVGCVQQGRRCALEPAHRRVLVDADPEVERASAETPGEQRRLHGRGRPLENPGDVRRRAGEFATVSLSSAAYGSAPSFAASSMTWSHAPTCNRPVAAQSQPS